MPVISEYYKINGEEYVKAEVYDDVLYKLVSANEKISELESELDVKENLLKIKNWVSNEKKPNNTGALDGMNAIAASKIFLLTEEEMAELCSDKKTIPFSDEHYEEEVIKELEDRYHKDCATIHQLQDTVDVLIERCADLMKMRDVQDMKICETNPKCKKDPYECGFSINCSTFEDYIKNKPTRFIGGLECPYTSFKKLVVTEVGQTDKKIESTDFPGWKQVWNQEPICKE